MVPPILSVLLVSEHDVVLARQRARALAARLGFDRHDETRVATAVSEIARNAVNYGGGGKVEFGVDPTPGGQALVITVSDKGRGIANLAQVLEGRFRSSTGMGQGIAGARRLMDGFDIATSLRGTRVILRKNLPQKALPVTPQRLARVAAEIDAQMPGSPLDELRRENQELLHALEELRRRQEELNRVNKELEETSRGVVALYAELDERAEQLKRADQAKSQFLSHVSHEFRTPLTSILALSRLLLDQEDGPLAPEQQKQAAFIRQSAEVLLEIVNDLLDLSRVEAGKTEVRPAEVEIEALFGTLRGMMRPLLTNDAVNLVFECPAGLPPLVTDQAMLAQILRNLVSNALKFTERGEVRVTAALAEGGGDVVLSVSDTGIGIAAGDRERIFQEFVQIENPLQAKTRGSGLGLSLTRKMLELLGGSIRVESEPGVGSTFSVVLPLAHAAARPAERTPGRILIVDDEEIARYLIRQCLELPPGMIAEAVNGAEGLARARSERPAAVLLDLRMPEMDGFEVLKQLRADPATRTIPVVVITSKSLNSSERKELESGAAAVLSKEVLTREHAGEELRAALARAGVRLAVRNREAAAVERKEN